MSPTSITKRSKGDVRRDACLMLVCSKIRAIFPLIAAEVLQFLLLLMSFGDALGRAFASYEKLKESGYTSDQINEYFQQLVALGLLRFIRKHERDPATGKPLPNVYQFTPAIYYIRASLLPVAMGLTSTEFAPLLINGEDANRHFNALSNEVYNQLVKPTPDHQDSLTKSSKPSPDHQSQKDASKIKETDDRSNGSASSDTTAAEGGFNQRELEGREAGRDQRRKEIGETLGTNRTRTRDQNCPSPSSAAPPSLSHREKFGSPLADPDAEYLAGKIAAKFDTHRSQMRELIATYGQARVLSEFEALVQQLPRFKPDNPAGLLTYRLRNPRVPAPENSGVDWEKLKYAVASDQWHWDVLFRNSYERYLSYDDCPAWFREAYSLPLGSSSASIGD
ncbi:MAG: hypothetical protein IPO91_03305 [Chloroflexi bacterium]|nr:hypothetical protein [Chloroflexota bacterium]